MRALRTATIFCLIGFALADHNVESEFKKFEIVPDILSKGPQQFVKVKFGNQSVNLGNELTPTQVKDEPEIHYNHEHGAYYTLVMTDPDAPSREAPVSREWHHWIVGNIPEDDVSKGEVLTEFVSSAPPEGSGLHRYVFLVYKQPCKIEFDEPRLNNTSAYGREGFSVEKFAAKYELGDPVAGNFYQAQYDDYVLVVHEQLGI